MKIAYLVFAYKNPDLLHRTVRALATPQSRFFIHIDAKSDISQFSQLAGAQVCFTPTRLPVYWGEFSGVRAILLLMREALAQADFDYCVLLSGSEYPLQSAPYIEAFLQSHQGVEFINLTKIPNAAAGKPLTRINTPRITAQRPLLHLCSRLLTRSGLWRRDYRRHIGPLQAFAGNTWWALTGHACCYILQFVDADRRVQKFFETTFAPEEMFFHTILGNSHFVDHVRRNFVYEDWSSQGSHPAMLTESHVAALLAGPTVQLDDIYGTCEALFARKLSDSQLHLVNRIEAHRPTNQCPPHLISRGRR
jgi:hypothetical protein